jgi:hypothetical protein
LTNEDYDMEDEFKDLPKKKNRPPVIDDSAVVLQMTGDNGPIEVDGKISSAAVFGMALGT